MAEKYNPEPVYPQQAPPPSYGQPAQPAYQQPHPVHQHAPQQAYQQHPQPVHQQPHSPQPIYHQPQAPAHVGTPHQAPQGVLTHQGPPQATSSKEWTHSYWDCFDPIETCLCGWCVPCVLFGKTQARLKDPSLKDFNHCNGTCCGWLCLAYCGCSWIFQALKRGEIRDQFGIEGSAGMDFLCSCCCPCCGLVQQEKEVVARQKGQGYQKTPGMNYP